MSAERLRGAAQSLRNCEEPWGCILRDRIADRLEEGAQEIERLLSGEYTDKRRGRSALATMRLFAAYPGKLEHTMRFTRREVREVLALLTEHHSVGPFHNMRVGDRCPVCSKETDGSDRLDPGSTTRGG